MDEIVEKALSLWDLVGADYQLIATRENAVYKINTINGPVALRLHRQGYRTDQELWSELKWMAAISEGGIVVPEPIPSVSNDILHIVDGIQVDILTWLSGVPVSRNFATLTGNKRSDLFFEIGRTMAMTHNITDAWVQPDGFTRWAWNRDGLLGEAPLWDRFWDNPALSQDDQRLFLDMRDKANIELKRIENELDYGLIHADMVHDNVMLDGKSVYLIDFDDGGFGFRIFDIATVLLRNMHESDYETLNSSLVDGYHSVRDIDLASLNLFLVLRSATYLGWIIKRMNEIGADARNEHYIVTTRDLTQDYLATQ